MDAICIIPARFASERFPGKVLADATGRPLIVHVIEAARNCGVFTRVVVACDDERIAAVVEAADCEAVLTAPEHPNGTSRIEEAARVLRLDDDAVIVNIQGDEPEIEGEAVRGALAMLEAEDLSVSTAACPITRREDHLDPNVVKVVLDQRSRAMYFSRAPVPYPRALGQAAPLRHFGLYVYRRAFLHEYVRLASTPLERSERLEQLRILEHGHEIGVFIAERGWSGIDTPEQYEAFVARWRAGSGR